MRWGKRWVLSSKKYNAQFPIKLDSFQTEFGKKSDILLKQHFPEVAEEIRGVNDIIMMYLLLG